MQKKIVFILFLLRFGTILGQNTPPLSKADSLLKEIEHLQIAQTDFYDKGKFATLRGKHRRDDNTLFFSSLIGFTLQGLRNDMPKASQVEIDSILIRVVRTYPSYKNKTGIATYNFWKTNPAMCFPHSPYLSKRNKYHVPDDADCTALVYLTDTSIQHANWLKEKLSKHANLSANKIKSTYRKCRNLSAYSTWFGKNMPIEFDICVQSNVLYWVCENKLPFNKNDSATVQLIKEMVLSGRYLRDAGFVSPSYKKPSIVLYHLARLLGKFDIAELSLCKERIKGAIENELTKKNSLMEKVILSTALIRMGGHPAELQTSVKIDKELNDFVFFEADLFSAYARPCLKFISNQHWFSIPFRCKAYHLALLMEYEVLKTKP